MKISVILEKLDVLFSIFRNTGYTTIMKKILKNNDVYYIVLKELEISDYDENVRHKIIPVNKLSKLEGVEHKPILIDNGILQYILNELHVDLRQKQIKIQEYEWQFCRIQQIINNLSNRYPTLHNRINENISNKYNFTSYNQIKKFW